MIFGFLFYFTFVRAPPQQLYPVRQTCIQCLAIMSSRAPSDVRMGPTGPGSGTGSNPPTLYPGLNELDTEVRLSDVPADFTGSHSELRRRVATADFTDSPADAGTPTPGSAFFS